jgi:hypothetical protein
MKAMQISATPTAPTILAPRFMARFSGLPFDAVAGLRQPRSIEWAVQLIDLRNRLEEHGRMISDELAQLVQRGHRVPPTAAQHPPAAVHL